MFALIILMLLMAIYLYLAHMMFERVFTVNAVRMLLSVGVAVFSIFLLIVVATSLFDIGVSQFVLLVFLLPMLAAYLISKYNDFDCRAEEVATGSIGEEETLTSSTQIAGEEAVLPECLPEPEVVPTPQTETTVSKDRAEESARPEVAGDRAKNNEAEGKT